MEFPYNVYGGLQDNATWYGPSRAESGRHPQQALEPLTGGDGFWAFVDPERPRPRLQRVPGRQHLPDRASPPASSKDIKPSPKAGEPKYRFNWNTPIHMSPERQGDDLLRRAVPVPLARPRRELGAASRPTSPPTTPPSRSRTSRAASRSTTRRPRTTARSSRSPSRRRTASVIWVGTDDGNLQVTRDGGKTWTNVVGNVPGLPKDTWVSSVAAEPLRRGHRLRHLRRPHDRRHEDLRLRDRPTSAKTWQSLASGDLKGYAHVVKRGPGEPGAAVRGHRVRALRLASTAAGSGASSPATCRTWRCATSRSTRATTT